MDKKDVVREVFAAIERNDVEAAGRHLTDDFTFVGPVPEPVAKDEYLHLHEAMLKAIPDWKFNATEIVERGDMVETTVHITGTHTGLLDPLLPGMPPVPPTGRHIELPDEPTRITFRGDKVATFEVEKVEGGGAMGLLAQVGVQLPPSSDTM